MLDTITDRIPDIITVGGVIASALVAVLGRKWGSEASKFKHAEPATSGIAAGFVDKDLMVRLTLATENIAYTLKELVGIQTDEHERQVNEILLQLQKGQDDLLRAAALKKNDDDDRARRSVDRTGERVERTMDRTADRIAGRRPKPD